MQKIINLLLSNSPQSLELACGLLISQIKKQEGCIHNVPTVYNYIDYLARIVLDSIQINMPTRATKDEILKLLNAIKYTDVCNFEFGAIHYRFYMSERVRTTGKGLQDADNKIIVGTNRRLLYDQNSDVTHLVLINKIIDSHNENITKLASSMYGQENQMFKYHTIHRNFLENLAAVKNAGLQLLIEYQMMREICIIYTNDIEYPKKGKRFADALNKYWHSENSPILDLYKRNAHAK